MSQLPEGFFDKVKHGLGISENSGSYDTTQNSAGAFGKYQFIPARLQTLGRGDITPDNFTPQLQEEVMNQHLEDLYNWGSKKGYIKQDASPDDVAGLLWAGHLGGYGGLRDAANGLEGASDSLGTSVGAYFRKGKANYSKDVGPTDTPAVGKIRNAVRDISNVPSKEEEDMLRRLATQADSNIPKNTRLELQKLAPWEAQASILDSASTYYKSLASEYGASVASIRGEKESVVKDAILKSVQGKASEEDITSLVSGLSRGFISRYVNTNSDEFQNSVKAFETKYPDIKLPYRTTADIDALVSQEYDKRAAAFDKLNTGGWFDSPGQFFKKLGHVAGYTGASVAKMLTDPLGVATAFVGGPALAAGKLVVGGIKMAAAEFMRQQVTNQQNVGTSGVKTQQQMLAESALTGAAGAGIVGLGKAISKLAHASSSRAGNALKTAEKELSTLRQKISTEVLKDPKKATPEVLAAKEAIEDAHVRMKSYSTVLEHQYANNSLGGSKLAKAQIDNVVAKVYSDLANGRPVRDIQLDIKRPTYVQQQALMAKPTEGAAEVSTLAYSRTGEIASEWNKFKNSFVTNKPLQSLDEALESRVPVLTKDTNELYRFDTHEDAAKFLKSAEGRNLMGTEDLQSTLSPDGKGVYLTRSADIEDALAPSAGMKSQPQSEVTVLPGRAVTSTDPEALAAMHQYPNYSTAKPINSEAFAKAEASLDSAPPAMNRTYNDMAKEMRRAEQQASDMVPPAEQNTLAERVIETEATLSPETIVDIGEGEEAVQKSIKEIFQEMKEEKLHIDEFDACRKGAPIAEEG